MNRSHSDQPPSCGGNVRCTFIYARDLSIKDTLTRRHKKFAPPFAQEIELNRNECYSPLTKVNIPNGITNMATIKSVMANDMRK